MSGGYSYEAEIEVISGSNFYLDELCGYHFKVNPFAFFQVNVPVFEKLIV